MEKLRINTMITGNETDEAVIFLMIDYAAMLRIVSDKKGDSRRYPFRCFRGADTENIKKAGEGCRV